MGDVDTFASWNPALRADTHEHNVATNDAIDQSTSTSLHPSEPPQEPVALDAIQSPESETTAHPVDVETPPIVDEHINPTEKPEPQGTAMEATPASDDSHVTPPVESEATGAHVTFPPLAEEERPVEFEPAQAQEDPWEIPNRGAQTLEADGPGDTSWMDQDEHEERSIPVNGSTNHDLWGSPKSVNHGEDDFFDQLKTQTKPIYVPPEAESRFEEGVPLLDDSVDTPIEPPTNQQSQIGAVFDGDGDDDDDDGFFSGTQQPTRNEDVEVPFHIKRKSTTQVIDSLHVDSPASPLSSSAEEFNSILAAAASDNPGKVAAPDDDLAARWGAELSDDDDHDDDEHLAAPETADTAAAPEEDLAARWQAELDDDDLLLEDDPIPEAVNGDHSQDAPPALQSPFGTPQSSARPKMEQASYTPHQPSTSDLIQGVIPSATASSTTNYFQQPPVPNISMNKAESFAERSKEGYKSPYDLPEDLAPRRRPVQKTPVISQDNSMPPPPPRSASIPAPPPKSASPVSTPPTGATPPTPTAAPKNFYEELPMPPPRTRSRPASSGRYAPPPHAAPTPAVSHPPVAVPPTESAPALPPSVDITHHQQLQQPERLGPYANALSSSAPSAPAVPSAASRYSPRPPGLQPGLKSSASPRYSPAPPPGAAPTLNRYASQPNLPFQPRTSSPLAYHEKASYLPQESVEKHALSQPPAGRSFSAGAQPPLADHGAINPSALANDAVGIGAVNVDPSPSIQPNYQQTSPPRNPYAPPDYIEEFSRRLPQTDNGPSPYAPPPVDESQFRPPRRSITQSPSQQKFGPRLSVPSIEAPVRPASVHGSSSPTKAANPYAPSQGTAHTRAISQSLEFIPPTDGREHDPLERWKGAPIVKFGFGGAIVSSFPVHVPRYSAGQTTPKIKSSPGEVKIVQLNDWTPSQESIVQHPGPLRAKSKKKDLIAWLSSKIAAFENEGVSGDVHTQPDFYKRHGEKILLWKIIRVLVEHDGAVQASTELQQSLRNVIFPHLQNSGPDQTDGNTFQSFNNSQSQDVSSRPDATDSKSLEGVRDSLLLGDREKAVWNAVDNRLWGHAMIIASTLDKSVWKQVVQEFVRREVRSVTGGTESLAALYEIFVGNIEESIDELVPPSARAGLQMVSKVAGQGASRNALAGLESWRDTLGMVLGNRSPEDHQALLALGRLLLSYGRVEAAHICLIFSKAAIFGGPDDPQANVVLLGIDHRHSSPIALQDDDAILLTEAYEYATSVLAGTPTATLPHLLSFKLIHAWSLVNHGRKPEAQQYCDAIAASLKATTKPSPYHHQHLFYGVDELSASLRQTTDGSGSWISKPSMEKVSSSMWNKFTNFVAGDESDAASTGSGKGEGDFGPFAKMAGTPTVSRSPSVSDLYGSYPMPAAQPIPGSGPSRYQPSNQYAPSSSPEQGRGRSSLDSQRSASYGGLSYSQRRGSQELPPPAENPLYQSGPYYSSPSVGYQSTPPQTSYMPLAPVEEDMVAPSFTASPGVVQETFDNGSPYQPPAQNLFNQPLGNSSISGTQPNESTGYMPPASSTGYEPPSIGNAALELDSMEDSEDEKPKKNKSMLDEDEDEDIAARAATLKKAQKAENDRIAEKAFREAAEADAKKAAAAKGSGSSWIPGWFKRGNKEIDNRNATGGGPIRAKLGEENSFYYDNELKKWVNKKDPGSATPARATPPPPRGPAPPSRSASGSSVPPPPASAAGSRPPSSAGAPPPMSGSPVPSSLGLAPPPPLGQSLRSVSTGAVNSSRPGSSAGPPPRPATSLSNASSIDDLLGAPQARKGGAAKGKKKGRYVDVMAQ